MTNHGSQEVEQNKSYSSYCIGSGWWCSDTDEALVNPKRKLLGAPSVRAVGFFQIWLESIKRVTSPASIVIVDSCSPVKPAEHLRDNIAWIDLPFNARHSVDHLGRWSGWMRSVLVAGQYALASDAEYFVYVEQDCLLSGAGIIEHCILTMRTGTMFGSGQGTPQPIQQSFFIVRRDRLAAFLKNLSDIKPDDRDFAPEWKFVCATWRPLVIMCNLGFLRTKSARKLAYAVARIFFFEFLPVGSGRTRPLPVDARYWYFQHGNAIEVACYLENNSIGDASGSED